LPSAGRCSGGADAPHRGSISLYFRPNPGAILIEVLWLAIASFAIGRAVLRRR
jgi:hypothetical protein